MGRRLVTQSGFAKRTSYSRARISQLVKEGVIVLVDGKIDPIQAETAIQEKIFRPWHLDKFSTKRQIQPCNKCADTIEDQTTWYCSRLKVLMTCREMEKESPETVICGRVG